MLASKCEQLNLDSNAFVTQDDNKKVIPYTIGTWDQFTIQALQTYDMLSTAAKSPCGQGLVEEAYLVFTLFEGKPEERILTEKKVMPIPKLQTQVLFSRDYPQLKTSSGDSLILANYYMFTKRQGSNKLYLNIESFYFQRQFADLIASIEPDQLSIDQYLSFTLNATSSFDSENSTNKNFIYNWECPGLNNAASCNTKGPLLNISFSDRLQLEATQAGNYEYKVSISQGKRQSAQATAIVVLTSRDDYSDCVVVKDATSLIPLSYNYEEFNKTLYLTQNQQAQINYEVQVSTQCETAVIESKTWIDKYALGNIDPNNKNRISISNQQLNTLNVNQLYSVIYSTKISLGGVKSNQFEKKDHFNILVRNTSLPTLSTQSIFTYGVDKFINITVIADNDTICDWECPQGLGGSGCYKGCIYSKTFAELQYIYQQNTKQNLSEIFDSSIPFNIQITMKDSTFNLTKYIYLTDPQTSPSPFNEQGISNCSIKIFGETRPLMQLIQEQVTLYFGCDDEGLTMKLMNAANLWTIQGLVPYVDYYNQSGQIFIQPYAFAKINDSDQVQISLNLQQLTKRFLQNNQSEYPPSFGDPEIQTINPADFQNPIPTEDPIIPDQNPPEDIPTEPVTTTNQTDINTESQNTTQDSVATNPVFSPSDPIPTSSYRLSSSHTLTLALPFRPPTLTPGGLTFSTRQSAQEFYTTNYTLSASDFATRPPSMILFQLRAVQTDLYNCSQVIIPLKQFTQEVLDQYYKQMFVPKAQQIWIDYYDGQGNYMGSSQLLGGGAPLANIRKTGTLDYRTVDRIIQNLQSKIAVGYSSQDDVVKVEFDNDMKRLLEISEMISQGAVTGLDLSDLIDNLFSRIITFLRVVFKPMFNKYDSTNFFEQRQRLILQKRVILIFYNLLKKSSASANQIVSVLDLFTIATADFEQLFYQSGEDPEFLRTAVFYIYNTFKGQLQYVNVANKNNYYNKIQNISDTIQKVDIKYNKNTQIKIQNTQSDTQSRTVIRITGGSQQKINISNANNPKEFIIFSGSEDQLLASANVSQLTVQYDTLSLNQMSTAATSTLITIKGFDSNGDQATVSFPKGGDKYFQMEFFLKPAANKTLFQKPPDNSTLRLGCAFFNEKINNWDEEGVELISYDQNTRLLVCKTFHLTQFSAYIYKVMPTTVTTVPVKNQTNSSNNNQTTNITVKPPPPPPIKVPINIDENDDSYYMKKSGDYAAAIIVISGVVLFSVLSSVFCCRYKNKQGGLSFSDQISVSQQQSPFKLRYWSVLKVHHPLISSVFPLASPVLAIPRVFHLLSLYLTLFLLVLSSLIHLVYIQYSQQSYVTTPSSLAVYGLIYLIIYLLLLRPLSSTLLTRYYLLYASITEYNPYETRREQTSSIQRDFTTPDAFIQRPSTVDLMYEGGDKDESITPQELHEEGPSFQASTIVRQHTNLNSQQSDHIGFVQNQEDGLNYINDHREDQKEITFKKIQGIYDISDISKVKAPGQGTPNITLESQDEEEKEEEDEEPPQIGITDIEIQVQEKPKIPEKHLDNLNNVPSQNKEEQMLKIENEQSFKGTRIILLFIQIMILTGELIAIYIIMSKVEDSEALKAWIKVCIGVILFQLLVIDSILCFIYALLIGKPATVYSNLLKYAGMILVGNLDYRVLLSLNLQLR